MLGLIIKALAVILAVELVAAIILFVVGVVTIFRKPWKDRRK